MLGRHTTCSNQGDKTGIENLYLGTVTHDLYVHDFRKDSLLR